MSDDRETAARSEATMMPGASAEAGSSGRVPASEAASSAEPVPAEGVPAEGVPAEPVAADAELSRLGARLASLHQRPVGDHPAVLEEIHRAVVAELDELAGSGRRDARQRSADGG